MTVADLVFYDVPGRGDVSVRIWKDGGEYCAEAPGVFLPTYPSSKSLLDCMVEVRGLLNRIAALSGVALTQEEW